MIVNCSKYQLSALNAQSFTVRIISAVNLSMVKDRSSTSLHLLDMMVTIIIKRTFMAHVVHEKKYKSNINMICGLGLDGNSGVIWLLVILLLMDWVESHL